MRRFVSWVCATLSILLCLGSLVGCGGGSPTSTSAVPTPAVVNLSPANSSVDLGSTLAFTATPLSASGNGVNGVPIVYNSSNTTVLSFVPAAGGLACAGKWDTLGRVCTPQGVGVTQVTATANGVTSPPVTVYVHQHVDVVTLTPINPPIPQPDCITLAQAPGIQNYLDFQARAFRIVNNTMVELTNTVGSFSFSASNPTVAKVSTSDSALNNNNGNQITQARYTAAVPGRTQIFAAVSGVTSQPADIPDKAGNPHPYFETCLVQSINLQVGNAGTNTSFAVSTNIQSTVAITPTVVDRLGYELKNPIPALTWTTSSPANATITPETATSGSTIQGTGRVGVKAPGGVSITASCAAPNCNVGVQPVQPVYSSTTPSDGVYVGNPITGLITGSPVTTGNVYVTTTQCDTAAGSPINGCQPLLVTIAVKTNTVGSSITLPSSPNSLIFSPTGSKGFLGSSAGLMVLDPAAAAGTNAITQLNSAPGKVLAVSLDGDKVIVSDTKSNPNQVYILSGLISSSTAAAIPLLISGATAAAFSPDGLKAFIAAGNTLYVYSTVQALKAVPLTAPAKAISFYANGSLAYLAGGEPDAVTIRNACDTTYAQAAAFPGRNPALFQALPDGIHALGVESPGVDVFTVQVKAPDVATPNNPLQGSCPFTVTSADSSFVNLGQGTFTPLKLIVAPDSSKAYILASNLGSVFVFEFGGNTVPPIALTGNPVPLDASLTSDGTTLYVGANDGSVHVVSTVSGGDLLQITFTSDNNSNKTSLCSNIPQTCNPDLVAVQP
jgi:hypothetical protein